MTAELKQAAQIALLALEYHTQQTRPITQTEEAIKVLMEALAAHRSQAPAEAHGEPVAWAHVYGNRITRFLTEKWDAEAELERLNREYPSDAAKRSMRPLVFADSQPQPKGTEPVGWTSEPIEWSPRQSEQVLKITRKAQPQYGFVYPLHASAQAPAPAQCTPALKRHALEAADRLAMYAAAPFFPDTEKRGVKRATTAEWWDGLAELIEEAQPLIKRGLHECTAPLADLQAPAVQDGKDAARYRWLSSDASAAFNFEEGSPAFKAIQIVWELVGTVGPTKADLDAAIDAAMAFYVPVQHKEQS